MAPSITMQTEPVRAAAQSLRTEAQQAEELVRSLRNRLVNLETSWQGKGSNHFFAEADSIISRLSQQSLTLIDLSVRVEREVQEWIAVDERGAQRFQNKALFALSNFLAAGGGLSGQNGSTWTTLPWLFGLRVPTGWSVSTLISSIPGLPDWLHTWLSEKFGEPEVVSPIVIEPEPEIKHGSFGALLEKDPPVQAPIVTEPEPLPQTIPMNPVVGDSYNVPPLAQGALYGGAACLPTSVSMVTNFFHSQDPENRAITPGNLVTDMDKDDGTYGKGVGFNKLNDEITALGYPEPKVVTIPDASFESLQSAIKDGPVIVNAGVKITSINGVRGLDGVGNTNHAMVVKGISADQSQVIVNDPWSGKEITYSANEFNQIWNKGQNYMLLIRPGAN